jgi:hypothetical protein
MNERASFHFSTEVIAFVYFRVRTDGDKTGHGAIPTIVAPLASLKPVFSSRKMRI